jgi:hypothetical protein
MRIAQHFSAGFKSTFMNESVKRTTDYASHGFRFCFQPSASRTEVNRLTEPSDKSLGYSHVVRCADENDADFFGQTLHVNTRNRTNMPY